MNSYSLFELHEYIKRVFLLNFNDAIWIKAEITQSNERKGHWYLNLVEYNDHGELIASASAIVWRSKFKALIHHHGEIAYDLLQEGTEVRLLAKVNFDARYAYSLHIEDIDLEYTFGKLFISRQETILKLQNEHLFDLNKELALPRLIKKIAVVSSSKAAGWADFREQLIHNPQDYSFKVHFHSVAVQGLNAVLELRNALKYIFDRHSIEGYDCIVILRGGGSKLDLAAFDHFDLSKDAALSPLPIICAIGHETDTSVMDMIVNQSVKTPTAAADFILNWNLRAENDLLSIIDSIQSRSMEYIQSTNLKIQSLELNITKSLEQYLYNQRVKLDNFRSYLCFKSIECINGISLKLVEIDKDIYLNDVNNILEQGFTIFQQDGKWIKKKSEVNPKATHNLMTFVDGSAQVEIDNIQ